MKTRTKGFILSFILVFAMLIGVFTIMPITASAETPTDTITVTGLTAPQAGQSVEEWGHDQSPSFSPDYDFGGGVWVEGEYVNSEEVFEVLDNNGGSFVGNFVPGRSYTLVLGLKSETPTLPLNATLNVPGFTSAVYEYGGEIDDGVYGAYIMIVYTVETPTITVSGFPAPPAGQSVEDWWNSISAPVTLSGGLTWAIEDEMFWIEGEYDNVEDAAAVINANGPFEGTFEAGKKYTFCAVVVPVDGETPAAATVVASGASNTAYDKIDEVEAAALLLTYTVGDITITGLTAPQAGQSVEEWFVDEDNFPVFSPDYGLEMGYWLEGECVNSDEVEEALDNNGDPFEGTFENGKKYTLVIIVSLDDGELPAAATVVASGASNTAYEKLEETEAAALFLIYTVETPTITVSGITAPQAGQSADAWLNISYPVFSPDYFLAWGACAEGAFDNFKELFDEDEFEGNFVSGQSYTLVLGLISETPTLPLNATLDVPGATSATYEYYGEIDDDVYVAYIFIVYTAEESSTTWTVGFYANGGEGSMTSVKVNKGDSYTLPECGFTAPDGRVFACWSVNGVEYAPGDEITPSDHTVVEAIWLTNEVTIAGVTVTSGEYLANGSQTPTAEKPASGGYVYYKDGVLTLHDFVYSGEGYNAYSDKNVVIYVYDSSDIDVVLEGYNRIELTQYDDSCIRFRYVDNVTFRGTGTLDLSGKCYYGISADDTVTFESGNYIIDVYAIGLNAASNWIFNGATVDSKQAIYGVNVTINGGTVSIYDDGNYACYANLVINGGNVTMISDSFVTSAVWTRDGEREAAIINGGTVVIKALSSAFDTTPTIGEGVTVRASTTIGGDLGEYNPANATSYQHVVITNEQITYDIEVIGGTANPSSAKPGIQITLTADPAPAGKAFDRWVITEGEGFIGNPTDPNATFVMSANDLSIKATYKDIPVFSATLDDLDFGELREGYNSIAGYPVITNTGNQILQFGSAYMKAELTGDTSAFTFGWNSYAGAISVGNSMSNNLWVRLVSGLPKDTYSATLSLYHDRDGLGNEYDWELLDTCTISATIIEKGTVTNIDLTYDLDAIKFNTAYTEGEVQTAIRNNIATTTTGVSINKSNSWLCYIDGSSTRGVGDGANMISAEKRYVLEFGLNVASTHEWCDSLRNGSLEGVTIIINGVDMTDELYKVELGSNILAVYLLIGAPDTTPIVRSVEIADNELAIKKGDAHTFTASVSGNVADKSVIWTVEGAQSAATVIGADGKLTVGADETAATITIKAASKADNTVVDTITVTVLDEDPYIESVTITPEAADVTVSTSKTFTATVLGTQTDKRVTWSVEGAQSVSTTIDENGRLTVGADETAETLTVKATAMMDDTKIATATVTVKQKEKITGVTLTYDKDAISLNNSTTEGAAQRAIRENITVSTTGVSIDKSNSWLAIRRADNGNIIGIGDGTAMVDLNKIYVVEYCLSVGAAYDWPATLKNKSLEGFTVTVNGVDVTDQVLRVDYNTTYNDIYITIKLEKAVCTAHVPAADDGDCTTKITCTLCGTETTPAKANHTGGTATCTAKAKCEECGKEYGELAEHKYSEATCTAKAKCSVCEAEYGELAAHTYVDGKCACGATDPNYTPETDEPKDGLGTGAIVGIVVGSVAVVGVGGFALFWFVIKKKSFADLIAVFKKK